VTIVLVLVVWLLGMLGAFVLAYRVLTHQRTWQRMFEETGPGGGKVLVSEENQGPLTRWLSRAGYRAPGAALVFLSLTLLSSGLGVLMVFTLYAVGAVAQGVELLAILPGAFGAVLAPVVYVGPWFILAVCCALPWIVVSRARRLRVEQIEQDLPVFLELLATLAQAGLGFDAAIEEILDSQPADRPLTEEFRIFQTEILSGRPRIQCLRRLARRVEVISLTILVSALLQVEQVGASVADILRRQADDLRGRRRERALALAATLPGKLIFPLVIGFMPGVFVVTLGPTFYQLIQTVDRVLRSR
jgi:tight adherence protein C